MYDRHGRTLGQLPAMTPQSEGAAAGSIVGSFLPFPGASQIMGIIGSILGNIIGGKPSNFSAFVEFSAGPVPTPHHSTIGSTRCGGTYGNVCGTEMDATTEAMGARVSDALMQAINYYVAQGIHFNSPEFALVVGQRDGPYIHHLGTGTDYARPVAAPGDLQGAVMGTIQWLSQFASPPLSSLAAQPTQTQPTMPASTSPSSPAPVISPSSDTSTSSPAEPSSMTAPAPVTAGFDWSNLSNFSTPYPYALGLGALFFTASMMRR